MELPEDNEKALYKVEYYEPEDGAFYSDWVWLQSNEVPEYRSSYEYVKVRIATADEHELYEEAYEDGYSIAMLMEMRSVDNGVTFRVEIDDDGGLSAGHKMFKCAICNEHKDFEKEVAHVNGYYLTQLVDDILWHICYDCITVNTEFDEIINGN